MNNAHLICLSVAALLAPCALRGQSPDYSALVSLWRLNGNVTDAYGIHHGTVAGTEQYVPGARANTQAISLDGNSCITAGADYPFDNTTPFSAIAWIKGTAANNDSTILGKMQNGGGYTGWELHAGTPAGGSSAGRLNVWLINAFGSSYIQVNSPANVLDDTWHHVAFTYDGSGLAAGVKIYVDGRDATGEASADNLSGTLANTVDLTIGARQGGAAHLFRGAICEASVWSAGLTPDEVDYLRQNGVRPPVLVQDFTASSVLVHAGVPFTLNWEVDAQASVSIDPDVGDVTSATTNGLGALTLTVEEPTTFTLTATLNERSDSRQLSVQVKPLISAVTASRKQLPSGAATVLSWEINPVCESALLVSDTGPDELDLLLSTTNGVGQLILKPELTTTYTLSAIRGSVFAETQITITVTGLAPEAAPDISGLAGVWLLNGNAQDAFGPNDGTFAGAETYVAGPVPGGGKAAFLDGNSYIRTAPDYALDQGSPFSATAWIKGPVAQDSAILGKMRHGASYTGWELHAGTPTGNPGDPGRLNVWLINSFGPSYIQVNSPVVVLDDTWHHVAFTYDGSSSAAGVRIYVDGVDATGSTAADSLTGTLLNDVDFAIGTRQNGAKHNFSGAMAEVSLWSATLTPENIAHIYQRGVPLPSLISSLAASATSVYAGQSVWLSWAVDPGATVSITPGLNDVTDKTTNGVGAAAVAVEEPATFTLTATLDGRTETRVVSVGVKDLLTSVSLNRTQVPLGGAAVISWVVNPLAEDIYLDQEPWELFGLSTNGTGSVVVSPSETTTYTFMVMRGNTIAETTLTLIVTVAEPAAEVGAEALISLWPLAGDALDAFGRNPGQWSANPAYVPGPFPGSRGAYFAGANFITAGANINLDANTPFSATAWINAPAGQDSTIIGKMRQGGTYTGWELHVGSIGSGLLNVWLINAYGPSFIQVNSPVPVLDNTWHCVGFTYDGSSQAAGVKIYVDGEDATGSAPSDNLIGTLVNTAELNIGSRQNGAAHLFRGAVHAAAVWSVSLAPEQMRYLYAQGAPLPPRLEQARFDAPSSFSFRWNSVVGKTYRLEAAATPAGPWSVQEEVYPTGGATGTLTTYTTASATQSMRFFRVRGNE